MPDQRFASRLEPQGSLSVFSLANKISCQGSPLYSYSTPILNWKALLCGRNVNNYTLLKGRVNDTKNWDPPSPHLPRLKMTHIFCCKSLPFSSSSSFQRQIALNSPYRSSTSPFLLFHLFFLSLSSSYPPFTAVTSNALIAPYTWTLFFIARFKYIQRLY